MFNQVVDLSSLHYFELLFPSLSNPLDNLVLFGRQTTGWRGRPTDRLEFSPANGSRNWGRAQAQE